MYFDSLPVVVPSMVNRELSLNVYCRFVCAATALWIQGMRIDENAGKAGEWIDVLAGADSRIIDYITDVF